MIDDLTSYRIADFIPFTADVYLRLLERVGETFWPLHLLTVALGLSALFLALRGQGRIACGLLALIWAWVGVIFLMQRYAQLNWAGEYFGWGFVAQAGLLLLLATLGWGQRRLPGPRRATGWMASGLAVFGLLGYPLMAWLSGHGVYQAETFGIHPDPTAVATLGIIAIALRGPVLWLTLLIPLLWCLVTGLTLQALDVAWAPIPLAVMVIALVVVIVQAMVGTGRIDTRK